MHEPKGLYFNSFNIQNFLLFLGIHFSTSGSAHLIDHLEGLLETCPLSFAWSTFYVLSRWMLCYTLWTLIVMSEPKDLFLGDIGSWRSTGMSRRVWWGLCLMLLMDGQMSLTSQESTMVTRSLGLAHLSCSMVLMGGLLNLSRQDNVMLCLYNVSSFNGYSPLDICFA